MLSQHHPVPVGVGLAVNAASNHSTALTHHLPLDELLRVDGKQQRYVLARPGMTLGVGRIHCLSPATQINLGGSPASDSATWDCAMFWGRDRKS